MKPSLSRKDIEEKIKEVFSGNPSSKEIKKLKSLAMSKNIKLKEYRKRFCKDCYSLFDPANSRIRIKNRMKTIKCNQCGQVTRWKLKQKKES
jgi:RNase P subunit RPR2